MNVTRRNFHETIVILIASIWYMKVMTSSESRPILWGIEDCIMVLIAAKSQLVSKIKLKDKRFSFWVCDIPNVILVSAPLKGSEGSNGFSELSPQEGDCILDAVTAFVEFCCTEFVLGGAEKQLDWLGMFKLIHQIEYFAIAKEIFIKYICIKLAIFFDYFHEYLQPQFNKLLC